jgi:TctA family transporter
LDGDQLILLQNIADGARLMMDPALWGVILLAGVYGLFIGSIPGLTATMATALLIPFAFFLDPLPAIAAIVTMSAVAIFAGDLPGALVRMPGTPASAAYVEDAYRLTRSGKGATVLGVGMICATIGGLIGVAALMIGAPVLAEVALRFTSFEYFWVSVLGLSAAVVISRGSQVKGTIALLIGVSLSMVGIDIIFGAPRLTFGYADLLSGIHFIPAMIGLFGLSEILRNVTGRRLSAATGRINMTGFFREALATIWKYKRHIPRGGAIGTGIGVLPGAGADIAAWVAYASAKNSSKEGRLFGRGNGHIEPIVAASSTNNAGLASAYVPTLVFGIPGDTITAILIGVLYMKGMQPGSRIFVEQPDLVSAVYLTFAVANLLIIPLAYLAIRASGLLLRIPRNVLMAVIFVFCIVGAYSVRNNTMDIWVMLAMGLLGFALERNGFPVAPVVLGIVLGPIVERTFMQSVIATDWDLLQFFTRPISALLLVMTVTIWFLPVLKAQGAFELSRSKVVAEQLIRPTGVVDPEVELRPLARYDRLIPA